jgi:hypothetical protein
MALSREQLTNYAYGRVPGQTEAQKLDAQRQLGMTTTKAPAAQPAKAPAPAPAAANTTPKTNTSKTTNVDSIRAEAARIEAQINDLKAQQSAMGKYGVKDSNDLEKDASGNYVPINSSSLKGDADYDQLDTDNKSLVDYFESILKSQDEQKKAAFQKALEIAGQQADPYWKQKINIFKDEFGRAIGIIDADLASHEKNLIAQKSEVERALTVGKEDLSIDEQAELAQEAKSLDGEILTTRDTMAARGLTSSTIRNQAEQKLNEASQYVVEGKKRTYDRNKRELEAKSAYNLAEIERQIADVRRAANEEKISTTRKAEGYLGSDALSGTQNLMGGINGSIIEDKSADVLARARALVV